MIRQISLPDGQTLRVPGIVPKLSHTPGELEWVGPALGEHTEAVLASHGYDAAQIAALAEFVSVDPAGRLLEVDLVAQEVRADSSMYRFELESEAREMLLEGLDGIDLTLKHRADIDTFVALDRVQRPWIYSTVEKARA